MKTKEQVEQEFRRDLQKLLNKYKAEINAEDHYRGYPECGEDIRIEVNIQSIYDENGECLQEYTYFDIGSYMTFYGGE